MTSFKIEIKYFEQSLITTLHAFINSGSPSPAPPPHHHHHFCQPQQQQQPEYREQK